MPESREEDLHSGYLQLPLGTTTLLTESGMEEGQVVERGNTRLSWSIRILMHHRSQKHSGNARNYELSNARVHFSI